MSNETIHNGETDHGSRPMPEFVKRGLMNVPGGGVYLKAAYRVLWFREEHPNWGITTELLSVQDGEALARATITDETGRIVATAHKMQARAQFPSGFVEKAETGAVARALALLGYGTQFGEFEEGDVADTPTRSRNGGGAKGSNGNGAAQKCPECGTSGVYHKPGCSLAPAKTPA